MINIDQYKTNNIVNVTILADVENKSLFLSLKNSFRQFNLKKEITRIYTYYFI